MERERERYRGGLLKDFKAKWPSALVQARHYRFVVLDVLLLVGSYLMVRTFGLGRIWRSPLMLVPWGARIAHRVLHGLLSLPVLPSPVIFYRGAFQEFIPDFIRRVQRQHQRQCDQYGTHLQRHAHGVPITITTPDGEGLSAIYFEGKTSEPRGSTSVDGPTLIRFPGNGEAWELFDPGSVRDYVDHGINVVLFNYRGVNKSLWRPIFGKAWIGELVGRYTTLERDACVCDCDAVVQYVRQGLGVKSEHVLLLGHSIGAAFSAQAAARAHTDVCVCNSRSFCSLSAVVQALAPLFFGLDGKSWLSAALRQVGYVLVHVTGWELDSTSAWSALTGFKWIEYSGGDHIIPPPVQLFTALSPAAASGVSLVSTGPRRLELENLAQQDNHNRSYTIMELRQHMALVLTAVHFVSCVLLPWNVLTASTTVCAHILIKHLVFLWRAICLPAPWCLLGRRYK